MLFRSIPEWLKEQEQKRNRSIFLLEWILVFACALPFWIILFLKLEKSVWSPAAAALMSTVYACGFVYARLHPLTNCEKCRSPLPLIRREIDRRHLRDEEQCLEIVRGGEEYWEHFIEIYNRIERVEMVRFRCVKCKAVWDEVQHRPASKYEYVRTIKVKD
jgi:uncharacterized protein with PIN domain